MGKTLGYGEITVANMTEPFTVMLTNEAQQFATDSNRKVTSAQSYYTDIIVIRGSQERTDYTIGNITSSSGITVSKSSKRVTFSVSAGATIRADTGVIEIPITLDGQTVKKQFSWSCGKQGPQGVKGNDGNSFAWNMLSETNCGKKHWGTESSGGKYSVEDFITEDNINAVKLICTEGISTSNWSYVLFKDIKMLKQLKPSTKYTLSYDIKANRSGAISHSICKGDVSNFCTNTVVVNNIIGNETWQHISVVLTTNDLKTTPTNEILYLGRNALSKVGYSIIKNLKLVEGDINTPWSPSQSDIEGKGVVKTIQYYLATSQASGVTSSTSGWSTDITTQKLTADKKYLWNCYQTKYSDGTSEPISTPKVIGVYGDKGQNAKNLSITPSSQYFKSTDGGKTFAPNAITIKPTIQGEISFGKWQYSIDGGVSFTDVVSGQKGLTISNNVLTVSKDSSLYSDAVTMVTFRAVANDSSFYDTCSIAKIYDVSDIEIGGRNLLLNSDKEYVMGFGIPNTTWTDGYAYIGLPTTRINGEILPQNNAFLLHPEAGKTYTQTIWIETDADVIDLNAAQVSWFTGKYGHVLVAAKIIKLADNSYKLTSTHTVTKEDSDIRLFDILHLFSALDISNSGTYLKFGKLKVEQGNVSTDWTPAPEDVQTAILSTKSEISDVSLKVDKNKQAIEQRVTKTTYQQDLNLVKGDISKANEGLNKWRYEIYPKSLFASEYQGKSTMDVFAKSTNLTPSQSVLINDTDLSIAWNYAENYIGYALTFTKFSAAKSVAITFAHDDGAHIYLNGKLIGGSDAYNRNGESLTLGFVKGWNCIEVVVNEGGSTEGFTLGTTISAISECQLMNCYYGTPVARQSHITNQLVENTTNIDGVSGSVQKVMSTVGGSSKIDEFVNNYSTWKKKVDGIETRVGKTYVTKNDFDGLEIGGVNLFVKSTASIGWWISDTGVLNANGGWGYSDYINVSGMKNYIASGFTNLGISPATCFYDSNKTFISGVQSTNQNSQDSKRKTLPIPSNAKYMRFSFMRVDIDTLKIEQGTKATAYSPAPEDDEINGQNLVSNLPSNWEQGTVTEGSTTGTTYANTKSSSAGSVRPKELIPVSGNITISTAYSNQSKKPIRHWIAAYDVNKNYLGNNYVSNAWNSFPRTLNMKDAKYIAIMVGYTDSSAITPSDISQICLKIERGTSATPFTLAPEDVNGKIVNVETIANQTADKFSWIVKSGTSSSNFEITDRLMNLVSANINLDGIVSFMNTAKGDGRKNLYNLDYSSFENVASQEDAICYAKDNGVTSVGIDSSVSYDGDKSLKISYTTANLNSSTTPLYLGSSANNYGCVKIQAGKQYILSCYVKSDSTTGLFMIDIQGHDTPDTKTDGLYLSNIDPRKLPGSSTGVNLSTDWQRAVCAIKVADNATGLYWSVVPLIWGRPSSSSAPKTFNVWVDCIMLEEVDSISNEPGTYILDKETIIDGGSIKTDTITGNQILAGSITADKIATDAIKSHNYISSGGTQGSFLNLGDGSFTSPNLSWDSNGNLIAKNANLSGEITATKGTIGKYEITDQWLTTGSGSTCTGIGGNQAFWAGGEDSNSAPFRVGYDGKLTSSNADITGTITATEGKIGRYDITSTYLMTNSGSNASGIGGNQAFWAGAEDSNSAPFRVGYDGKLTSSNADITGTITATEGKIGRYDITSTYLMTNSGSNASGIGGNQAFWAGAEDSNSAPFRVGYDGSFVAENATIYGNIKTGNIGDAGDTAWLVDGHLSVQGTANDTNIYSTWFKFGIGGDYYLKSVSDGVECYRNLYATDFIAGGWIYNASGGHYTWRDRNDAYISCGNYNNTNNVYYYAGYHAFYVNGDSGSGMMYIETSGVSSRKGFRNSSDERIKQNFSHFDDNFIDTYMSLEPVQYQFKNDTNDKYHFGFKAQQTERILNAYGQESDKSYGICATHAINPEKAEKLYGVKDMHEEYTLAYDELIAPTTYMVQHTYKELESTKNELEQVKQEKADLEARLQIIEAKLGL